MNPRTLWDCHPVAFMMSARLAPSFRRSMSMTVAFLLSLLAVPAFLAPLAVFLVEVAFLAALALAGATCAPCRPTWAFFVPLGFSAATVAVAVSASAVV